MIHRQIQIATLPWMLFLLVLVAEAAAFSTSNIKAGSETRLSTIMIRGEFMSSPEILHRTTCILTPSRAEASLVIMAAASPNQSLKQQILQGATRKLMLLTSGDNALNLETSPSETYSPRKEVVEPYTYYVREGHRSEIDAITDTLMNSFHPDSKPSFDSYIRRYKYNHVLMSFDAIEECDRGLFVACAIPMTTTTKSESFNNGKNQQHELEQIVGFCSVDGRTPDPSCKIEFLTPSTLAGTSPRPYLSDLGVSTLHRRRGIGNMLVRACEHWSWNRGYDRLYLKVEKENKGAIRLYSTLGYTETKLPWEKDIFVGKSNSIILMEKSRFMN